MNILSHMLEEWLKLPPPETRDIQVERSISVPMPDGAVLLADRHFPRGGGRPPLILVRSPYGRRGFWGLLCGRAFAERGFQVLLQSCRGTFGSGGVLDPFGPDERRDGLATVAWMRRQPWYPGAFGTFGPSYLGMVQWAIAADAGPEHRAIAAQVTTSDLRAPFYGLAGESFSLQTMLGWVAENARQERPFALLRQMLGGRRAERRLGRLCGHLPLRDLDRLVTGRRVPFWQEWLAHNEPGDGYWNDRRFQDTLPSVTAPVHLLGGWYDFLLPALLRDYAALREAGRAPHLTVGPWRHADNECTPAGIRESLTWLRAHLLGDTSGLRPDPVRIFVTGADEWRDLPAWPPRTEPAPWYLQADGGLSPAPPTPSDPDRYTYDPADPTPNLAGPVGNDGVARVDNRPLEARADVLTYTGAPLEDDMEVAGGVTADLFVRSSLPHTDFFARLCDVDPEGESLNICDALLRLVPGRPSPEPDGTLRVRFALWPAAHRFRRGHRLRLLVASGAHPRFARNPGSGEPLATATTLLRAEQRVFHDPDHPSAIILPVARA